MAKYKFAKADSTSVNDTEEGIHGIHPGIYLWDRVQQWVKEGNTIEPFETPEEEQVKAAAIATIAKLQSEVDEVKAYPKLQAIANMTPTQVGAWVDANVTTLAAAKDAIKTLAMAVCVLAKRL